MDVDTVYSTAFDRDGNIYAVTEKKIFALDPGLQVLFTVEGKDMTGALTPLGDGTLGMICSSYNEETQTSDNVLKTIDPGSAPMSRMSGPLPAIMSMFSLAIPAALSSPVFSWL